MNKILALLFLVSTSAFSAEQCPVNKISLARGLSCEVLQLLNRYSKEEPTLDAICLKLGRVSAILRRTQGQLPAFPESPIPPKSFKERAIEIEGFCGVGPNTVLPRGIKNPDYLVQDQGGFKQYMNDRLREEKKFIQANQDVQGCEIPAKFASPEQEQECAGSQDNEALLERHSLNAPETH